MTAKDGQKLVGRFIKKGQLLEKVVKIESFSFDGPSTINSITPDNPDSNIIHTGLHEEEEVDQKLRPSSEIDEKLDGKNKRHVIKSQDFTDDWFRIRKRHQTKKRGKLDEEDELELELEYLQQKSMSNNTKSAPPPLAEPPARAEHIDIPLDKEETLSAPQEIANVISDRETDTDVFIEPTELSTATYEQEQQSIKEVGDAIKSVQENHLELSAKLAEMASPLEDKITIPQRDTSVNEASSLSQPNLENNYTAPDPIDPAEHATPSPTDSSDNINPQEETFKSFESYKEDVEPPQPSISEEELNQIIEEAKKKGYEQGFKVGEQKATIQAKQQINELSSKLYDTMAELEGFKVNVLKSSQENFIVIIQAMLEALLRKEFKVNPESFASVIEKAISEAIPNDDFKILINSQTFNESKDLFTEELKSKLVPSDKIPVDDFRIESSLTVVDGNITEIVKDLLQEADLDLFDMHEKVG